MQSNNNLLIEHVISMTQSLRKKTWARGLSWTSGRSGTGGLSGRGSTGSTDRNGRQGGQEAVDRVASLALVVPGLTVLSIICPAPAPYHPSLSACTTSATCAAGATSPAMFYPCSPCRPFHQCQGDHLFPCFLPHTPCCLFCLCPQC